MKKIAVIVLCMMLLTASAFAEMSMIPASMALKGPSNEFNMLTATYILGNFNGFDADSLAAQLGKVGLTVVMQENYDKPMSDHSHTSGFTLATGTLTVRGEERNVAVISIAGTGNGEWYSNFDFAGESGSDCVYAENFQAAAVDIFGCVKPVLDGMEAPVIFVTGYSRGAACANLMGLMLNEVYNVEDIYVYTFATPNTVRFDAENDENIFNIVNVNDMVTHMPPEAWGFRRAGNDILLSDPEVSDADMNTLFTGLLGMCPDIDSYYNDRHSLTAAGLSDDGITVYELFLGFCDATSGDEQLLENAKQLFMAVASGQNDFSGFMPQFMMMMSPADGSGTASLFAQHMPDVYVGLMLQYGK